MQCSNVVTLPRALLQFRSSLHAMMDHMHRDPKMAELMNTSLGRYLNSHPFFALALLVFGAMATVPIGLFLGFAMITFIGATIGFVLLEVFLLSLGGATLLCVLCGLAVLAIAVSSILSAVYITTSNILNFYYSQRLLEKRDPVKSKGLQKQ
ncbi:lipid droplet assembly factor 1-like [Megalops cyprinoides]|uniref:lipid droplet assembly factor 1-like n=1 Tax=Megalops cyprinoides TaxID=118141 RepID=UPI00186528C2|nr:lipid droplet assembly factor 1-like [Megalops cyprinoides]